MKKNEKKNNKFFSHYFDWRVIGGNSSNSAMPFHSIPCSFGPLIQDAITFQFTNSAADFDDCSLQSNVHDLCFLQEFNWVKSFIHLSYSDSHSIQCDGNN